MVILGMIPVPALPPVDHTTHMSRTADATLIQGKGLFDAYTRSISLSETLILRSVDCLTFCFANLL